MDVINGRFLDGLAIETVGIPGYPEGHPRISDEKLWDYLRRKVDALTAKGFKVEITTQLSFDTDAVVGWIKQVRQAGIDVPIRIGIPSPGSVSGILNFARQCRVATSAHLLQRYGWQVTSLLGTEGPERFLNALLQRMASNELGELRLHVYTLGDVPRAVQWFLDYRQRIQA
jgi:methylenetetrahydrofolate reductase (NADPH)